jgi:hypothetical protein
MNLYNDIRGHRYDRSMSDPGPPDFPVSARPTYIHRPETGPAPWPDVPPPSFRRPTRWPTFAALTVALVAIGVGIAGWFSPTQRIEQSSTPSAPTYTEQQTADAKADVCNAFRTVRQAISVNSNRTSPTEGDFGATWAIAANSRLALDAGAGYLLDRLADEPATSASLAAELRSLAMMFRQAAVVFLAEEPDSTEEELKKEIEGQVSKVDGLCK